MKPPPLRCGQYYWGEEKSSSRHSDILKVQQDGALLRQLAVDEVQHGRWEAICVLDQYGLVCQVIGGTVVGDGLAGGVGHEDPELPGLEQADGRAETSGGVAPQGPGAQDALPPLSPRVGEEEGQDGAGDGGEDAEQAGDLAGGEFWAGVARHGLFFFFFFSLVLPCPGLSCPVPVPVPVVMIDDDGKSKGRSRQVKAGRVECGRDQIMSHPPDKVKENIQPIFRFLWRAEDWQAGSLYNAGPSDDASKRRLACLFGQCQLKLPGPDVMSQS